MGSLTKGYIGKEDMSVQTNTSASETFDRTSSTGGTVTITKVPDIWTGTGKIEVAECETDVLSNDTNLSIKIGGTEVMDIDSSGNVQIEIDDPAFTLLDTGGLKLVNLDTGNNYSPVILFAHSSAGVTDYSAMIGEVFGSLYLLTTADNWASARSSLSISTDINLVPAVGYIVSTTQTHTSSDGSIAGTMKQWIFQDDDMADDATLALPTGVQGICIANAYGNSVHAVGMWSVLTDGTVLNIAGTLYDNNSATDGSLCLYDGGTGAVLKQRLGGAAKVRVIFNYY